MRVRSVAALLLFCTAMAALAQMSGAADKGCATTGCGARHCAQGNGEITPPQKQRGRGRLETAGPPHQRDSDRRTEQGRERDYERRSSRIPLAVSRCAT